MNKPFFSVVMPVYNCEAYVGRAIESVLEQTDSDWEFIIGDDASTDATPKIIAFYAKQDSRIRTFRNDINLNAGKTLNRAIGMSQGQWIAHIDADDFFNPNFLQILKINIERERKKEFFVSSWITAVDEFDKKILDVKLPPAGTIQRMIKIENFIYHSATAFKKTTWEKVGGYPQKDLTMAEDAAMWIRLTEQGIPLVMIPQFLVNYRIHYSNITTFNDARLKPDKSRYARVLRHNREWRISLYLKQNMLDLARREIVSLYKLQNYISLKNLQYLLLTYFPQSYVTYFMWQLRPRLRQFIKSIRGKKVRV